MQETTDAELVEQARRELPYRTAAFAQLMRRHEARVIRTATRYLHDPSEAQDVAQDVWLRVFQALPRFEARSAFTSWLFRIVQNVCATRFQTRKRRAAGRDKVGESAEPSEGPKEPNDDVTLALNGLGDRDREILILHYVSELSVEEVGDVLDLKASAVKMRLKRARERLETQLALVRKAGESR